METNETFPDQTPIATEPQPTPVPLAPLAPSIQPIPTKKTPWLVIVLVIVLVGVAGYFGFQNYHLRQQLALSLPETVSISSPVPSPSMLDGQEQTPTPTASPTKGASLSEIKYTLPDGWVAEIRSEMNDLYLSPSEEGGYLAIKVYSYAGNTGRREYYCQITNYCIDATYFTATKIGNITGYKASALDNSGGGAEYFGEKGDKFYIISSFSPSSPSVNFFDTTYQLVLDSLVF
ncbi:MAG: hypothetical protein ABII80_03505 [bacterium]